MATSTTNLGLIKPAGTDKIRIAQINSNMDVIDTKMGAVGNTPLQTQITSLGSTTTAIEQGLAVLATGNTHVAITSGQYVFVRNHTTLANGLYKASANIAANAALSTSNLTAVPNGGLNSLKADIGTLGTVLNENWIAESTSAGSVKVTNSITLTKGIWLAIITVPVVTSGTPNIVFGPMQNNVINYQYGAANAAGLQAMRIIIVSSTIELYGMTGGSSPVTYDSNYFSRGGIRAVKIGL
jgi:hypothetical protein